MRKSDQLALRISETRNALNESAGKGVTDENRAKVDELSGTLRNLESEYRAALTLEASEDATAEARALANGDPETRERSRLVKRAKLSNFVHSIVNERRIEGVEAECRAALFGDGTFGENDIPIELFEDRAITPAPDDAPEGSSAPIMGRVFQRSVAGALGIPMPAVAVGEAAYPYLNQAGGPTTGFLAKDAEADSTAASFTVEQLKPIGIRAAYEFRQEDLLELGGMEEALRRDLLARITDAFDTAILTSGANPVGLMSAIDAPGNPAGQVTFPTFVAAFAGMVDGTTVNSMMDLRAVLGPVTHQVTAGLFRDGGDASALDYVRGKLGGMMVSSKIPDVANKREGGIVAKTYPGAYNSVAPIWRRIELIRDPYSGAKRGQIALTGSMYANFQVIRKAAFQRVLFQTAA